MEMGPPPVCGFGTPGEYQLCVTLVVGLMATPVAVATTPAPQPTDWVMGGTEEVGAMGLICIAVVVEAMQPVAGSTTLKVMSVRAFTTLTVSAVEVKLLLAQK